MLETIIESTTGESFTLANTLMIIGVSIILGLIISACYIKTENKLMGISNFSITLVMLPIIISIIILLVGNNVARAFSLAGAFTIIRFRSVPAAPKDIAYIFFTLAVGLACGMGYIGYGIIITLILCSLMFILHITKFGVSKSKNVELKIVIPEDLNFDGVFDEIFEKYTNSWKIEGIRTRDFGALFELNYLINLKENINQKEFIDELRCKNGNLKISLLLSVNESQIY